MAKVRLDILKSVFWYKNSFTSDEGSFLTPNNSIGLYVDA